MLTHSRLRQLLAYDMDTGIFVWRVSRGRMAKVGDVAGHLHTDGYIRIVVDQKSYKAHRLSFLYMTKSFPCNDIDHINHVRNDNRWANLRIASKAVNSRNRSLQYNNTSGVGGVTFYKSFNKWVAYITANGKREYLGNYIEKWDAVCARKRAEFGYEFHKNHGTLFPSQLVGE